MKRYRLPLALVAIMLLTGTALAGNVEVLPELRLLELAFRGVADGNWFLVAGPVLAVVIWVVRWALAKFWPAIATSDRWGVALAAALAGAGAVAHAWVADEPIADTMTLIGAVKVFAMAVASYVTTRKLISPSSPASQRGYARLEVTLAIALCSGVAIGATGCPGTGPGPVIAQAAIDCVGEHQPKIDALITEVSPLVFGSSPDWGTVYQRAKQAGPRIGGCMLAELVQTYLGGRRAVSNDESWSARTVLEEFRGAEAGGATFKTKYGNL